MTPDLHELDAFAAVARHRSFRKAAAERGVSASALSHAMRGLEERLGVRLLHRTTRSVTPTEAGQRLLDRLDLREVADALEDMTALQAEPTGTLRLNVPRPAARLVLAPMLAGFVAKYPRVQVDVVTDDGLADIVGMASMPAFATARVWPEAWWRRLSAAAALHAWPRRPISSCAARHGRRASCPAMPALVAVFPAATAMPGSSR